MSVFCLQAGEHISIAEAREKFRGVKGERFKTCTDDCGEQCQSTSDQPLLEVTHGRMVPCWLFGEGDGPKDVMASAARQKQTMATQPDKEHYCAALCREKCSE